MASVRLTVDSVEREVRFDKLIMAGYTGRNQAEVQAHVAELASHGIPAPDRVPMLFPCAPDLLTTGEEISVLGEQTSGEGEFVLVVDGDEILVGAGSDQTDRQLEATDIPRSKQLCAKVMSREVWRLADLLDHWDELLLRSWVVDEHGNATPYQEGRVERMLPPQALLDYVRAALREPLGQAIVFSGTLPAIGGQLRPGPAFTVELRDPLRQQHLRCHYRVRVLDYLR